MKIKILLAGANASRHQFLETLKMQVKFSQYAASFNTVGTGVCKFKFDSDDIEITYVEDHELLQKNYKFYAMDMNAVILVDADEGITKSMKAACPKDMPFALNKKGNAIDGMKGVKLAVRLVKEKIAADKLAAEKQLQAENISRWQPYLDAADAIRQYRLGK